MQFEVWAPQADRVTLHCEGTTRALARDPAREGWWTGEAEAADGAGTSTGCGPTSRNRSWPSA
ncbi:hypothetical protein, partial [Streptomyces sp. WELS2]|uniref:hypothetical protein n=1 Tax=Streptomyces sp. WELS2 TaxID=2749435 RepID=UPI0028681ACE